MSDCERHRSLCDCRRINVNLSCFNEQNPVDFETAIKHTGYGWYNRRMLACFLPISLTTIMCTASPSFIVPATRCYFQLTPLREGMMFGAFYVGMMLSSFLWGFLIDTLGRQKLFFYGLLFTAILEFSSGLAQQFWTFIILKILCGFISCCPNSLGFTFLSEFYDKQHRDTIVLCAGGFAAISFVVQPILAYVLIPLDINFEFFYGIIEISNWRIFIIAGSAIMFLSTYLTYFMDESPKFLMAVGRHKEALRVFRKMYSQNTGNPPESYPVTSLASEVVSENRSIKSTPSELFAWDYVKEGWSQIKPLFMKPYLTLTILGSILQFMTMLLFTTFRFKLPKMYAAILAAEGLLMSNAETNVISDCSENISVLVDPDVYVKNIYIGAGSLILFWFSVYGSQYVDKHYMFLILNILCGFGIGVFPWTDGIIQLIIATAYVGITFVNVSLVISMSISAVSTTLRNVAFSVIMMFGIIGTILGNLVMPVLAEVNGELSLMVNVLFHSACLIVVAVLIKIKKNILDSH